MQVELIAVYADTYVIQTLWYMDDITAKTLKKKLNKSSKKFFFQNRSGLLWLLPAANQLNPSPAAEQKNPKSIVFCWTTYCGRPERRTAAGREQSSWLEDGWWVSASSGVQRKSGWAEEAPMEATLGGCLKALRSYLCNLHLCCTASILR